MSRHESNEPMGTGPKVVVERHPEVRGELPDTREWLEVFDRRRSEIVTMLRRVPALAEAFKDLRAGEVYRIEWPAEVLSAIREGKVVWNPAKDGLLRGIVRRPNGEIVKHLPLSKVSPMHMGPMMQLATQSMLADLTAKLEAIDLKISNILRGQMSDRFGILLGAEMQAREALRAQGPGRVALLRQACTPLNTFRGQSLSYMKASLAQIEVSSPGFSQFGRYLPGKQSPADQAAEAMHLINEHFLAAIRATRLLQGIYIELDQTGSAEESIRLLAEKVRPLLAKGITASKWLPYDSANPPEGIWVSTQQAIEQSIPMTQRLLTSKEVGMQIEVVAEELLDRAGRSNA